MRYSNLHTHTVFSDGKHTAEENVLSAIAKGMKSLGFSDHSFTACDPSYCMMREDYDAYHSCIEGLKEKYAGQLQIFTGMELDYYSELPEQKYDYLIASVHYIVENGVCYPIDHTPQQQEQCRDEVFGGDMVAVAARYYEMLTEHVKRVDPLFVGHFDVITKFSLMPEEDPAYRKLALDALEKIIPVCPYLEANTGAISRGWRNTPYPNANLLGPIREMGGKLLLGSDSHHKDNLDFFFDPLVRILKDAGYDRIHVFNGTGFDEEEL